MKEYIDKYLEYISSERRYSPRTVSVYEDVLKRYEAYACPENAETLKDMLAPVSIRNYEVHLIGDLKMSPRTIHLHLSVLSGFCKFLMKTGRLGSNPVRLVPKPKMKKKLPEFFKKDEMEEYFKSSGSSADEDSFRLFKEYLSLGNGKVCRELYSARLARLIVSILYSTGIRRSELVSLSYENFDAGRKVLKIRGKGDKTREIPIIPSLYEEILLYLQTVEALHGCGKDRKSPLLVTFDGRRLYPAFVDRAVKSELGEVGVTGKKSPHVLRHTLATELLDDGTDLNSIKELLGHSSLAATQVYTHNSIAKLKKIYQTAHPRAKNGGNHGD